MLRRKSSWPDTAWRICPRWPRCISEPPCGLKVCPNRRSGPGDDVRDLMPAEDEAMLEALGLSVVERRQIGESGGLGLLEDAFGHCLQRGPAGPIECGGPGDLPEETAPFDDDPIDVAG